MKHALVTSLVLLLLGVLLRDLLPFLLKMILSFAIWVGRKLGGRLGFRYFEGLYLNWLVTELQELRLVGIVSSDAAKKPKLEQVFVSLSLGEKNGRIPATQATQAVIEEIRRRKGNFGPLLKDLGSLLEKASPAERKESEELLAKHFRMPAHHLLKALNPQLKYVSAELLDPISREFKKLETARGAAALFAEVQLRHILRDNKRLAILGAPGAGKTTLLQYVGLAYAREKARDRKLHKRGIVKERLGSSYWRLPIYVPLGSIAAKLSQDKDDGTSPSLIDIFPTLLPPDLQSDDNAKKYFAYHLAKGNCILLLDGLDEVPSENDFNKVVKAIESLSMRYGNNQFIVTSRIAGWRTGLKADFYTCFVNDLNDEQIETFIDTWYNAVEINAIVGDIKDESPAEGRERRRRADRNAGHLKAALKENPGIKQLATNPMLLSIIALVHKALASLPQERAKLYAECAKIFLEQWEIAKGYRDSTRLTLDQKEAVMRRIAYALHTGEIGDREGGREATRGELEKVIADILPSLGRPISEAPRLLTTIVQRSGILAERQIDVLRFAHLTFQEYFTARYLAQGEKEKTRTFLLDQSRIFSDWWREVILLYSGMNSDCSEFLQQMHTNDYGDPAQTSLRLAGLCLAEAVQIRRPGVRRAIAEDLIKVRSKGEILTVLGDISSEAITYLVRWCRDEMWNAYAAVMRINSQSTDAGRDRVLGELAEMLTSDNLLTVRAALESLSLVLSLLITSTMVSAIVRIMKIGQPELAMRAAAIIAEVGVEKITQEIRHDFVAILRSGNKSNIVATLLAADKLGKDCFQSQELIKAVCERLRDSDWRVRQGCASAFVFCFKKATVRAIDDFFRLVVDDDTDVRRTARQSLLLLIRTAATTELVERTLGLLRSEDPHDRIFGARALSNIEKNLAMQYGIVHALTALFHDPNDMVRAAASTEVAALSTRSSLNVMEAIEPIVAAGSSVGRACAIGALGKASLPDKMQLASKYLIEGLHAKRVEIRAEAALAVGIADVDGNKDALIRACFINNVSA